MPSSQSSAAIAAPEPADRPSPPQNPAEDKSAAATDPNVGPSKARKPAWNVPSGTASQDSACAIMGAAAWPALAAAGTPPKASPKSTSTASSSSTDDLKSLDGSAVSVPATAKPAPTPEKMVAPAPQQPKPNSTPNLTRRPGTGSENTHNSVPNNNRSSRMVNGSNRRGNNSNNHFHHHNHNNNRGGYRGRDRGGANWNSWNNPRPPHFFWGNQAMAAAPPPVSYGYGAAVPSTFIAPMGYEFPYHPMFGHIPVGAPQFFPQMAAPGLYPAGELEHRNSIRKQIEFYFSEENLCRDPWLRRKMDAQGWVPISVIANFNRVKELTNDEHYILEVLSDSTMVEIQGNQIRRRDEWRKWLLSPPTNIGMVENQMQGLAIDHAVVANLEN